jgi:Raf kinase inhibitor-like YbhB/YbcL family protein
MMKYRFIILVAILSLLMIAFAGCGDGDDDNGTTGPTTAFVISSTAFSSGATIPVQYTCDGTNISPPLQWSRAPEGTQSLALIVDDPDAPGGTFVHWVLFNIPATTSSLGEGASPGGALPAGSVEGENFFGNQNYGGPCPPQGENHRYYFRLYALDTMLNLAAGAARDDVDQAMSGRILAQAELMGRYAR